MKIVVGFVASLLLVPILVIGGIGSAASNPGVMPVLSSDPSELEYAVLTNPNIGLTSLARTDVIAGIVDPRVLQLLLTLSERHRLGGVGPIKSGHSYFVFGTNRVSNHSFARAVDISVIDGVAVSPSNSSARDAALLVLSLQAPIRPDEFGSPWRFDVSGAFSDIHHQDHLHCGWGVNP